PPDLRRQEGAERRTPARTRRLLRRGRRGGVLHGTGRRSPQPRPAAAPAQAGEPGERPGAGPDGPLRRALHRPAHARLPDPRAVGASPGGRPAVRRASRRGPAELSTKAMKSLLTELGRHAADSVRRPAEPREVMEAFCSAMTARTGRPIRLVFRSFPPDIPVSGMRLDCGDHSIIVVEEHMLPEAQLVILGHELWHEEQGDGGHRAAGVPAAARTLAPGGAPEAVDAAVRQILTSQD